MPFTGNKSSGAKKGSDEWWWDSFTNIFWVKHTFTRLLIWPNNFYQCKWKYHCINLLTVQSYFWPGLTASARVLSASDNMFSSITIAPLPVRFRFRSFLFVTVVILAISFYNKKNLMKFIKHHSIKKQSVWFLKWRCALQMFTEIYRGIYVFFL